MNSPVPSGTVSFLFTDIQGSTSLWERDPEAMAAALEVHNRILHAAIQASQGMVFKIIGDAFQAAFEGPLQALQAALTAQSGLFVAQWDPRTGPLRVRMGIHTGPAEWLGGDYAVSHTLNRCARVMSAGHGGQILLSLASAEIVRERLPEGVNLADLGVHFLKGLSHPEQIFQACAQGLPQAFPDLVTLVQPRHNLPGRLASFVGRKKEIEQVQRLLSRSRLLTLTGSGGVGKTRLAIQAGHLAVDLATTAEGAVFEKAAASPGFAAYPDGIWWVELGSLANAFLLEGAISGVLGVQEQPGQTPLGSLTHYLAGRRLLLILDNCEHLIDACAQLVEGLLIACPHLSVLCTSREPLGLEGETVLRVPSMTVPDPAVVEFEFASAVNLVESLSRYEAMQLFVERARQQSGGLASFESLTPREAAAIASICRRLDGIPLAIELAAARCRVLSLEQIAARLDDTFRLLTGGSRTALPRHQTLMAAIDWSYNLLSDPERGLFRRLAVFSGGWSLEAVEFIFCDAVFEGGPECQEQDFLDLLAQLVNKSLVIVQALPGGTRYRFLETVRQYAREKLIESGEAEVCRGAHHDWFLNWVELGESRQRGGGFIAWMDQLEREFGNIRAALEWAIASGSGPETALRMGSALYRYWWARGNRQESHEWLKLGLTLDDPDGRFQRCRAQAHYILAWIGSDRDSNELIIDQARKAIDVSRLMGEAGRQNLVESLAQLTINSLPNSPTPEVLEPANEAVELGRRLGPPAAWSLGMALWARALAYQALAGNFLPAAARVGSEKIRGEYWQASLEAARESWALFLQTGDRWNAGPLILLGNVEMVQQRFSQAEQYFLQSLAAFSEANDKGGISAAASALLQYYIIQGDFDQAAHYLILTARSIYGQGNIFVTGFYLQALGNVAVVRMVLEPALGSPAGLRQVLLLLGCASTQVDIDYTQPVTALSFIKDWIRSIKEYPPMPGLPLDEPQISAIHEFLGELLAGLRPTGITEAFSEGKQLSVREALKLGEDLLLSFRPQPRKAG